MDNIRIGDVLRAGEKRYRILYVSNEAISVCKMDCEQLVVYMFALHDIMHNILEGEMTIDSEKQLLLNKDEMTIAQKKRYDKLKPMINEIEEAYGPCYINLQGRSTKREANEIMDKYGISTSTFWRIIRKYLQSGFSERSLIKASGIRSTYNYKNGKPGKESFAGIPVDDTVREHFHDALDYYKSGRAKSRRVAYDYMNAKYYYSGDFSNGLDITKLKPASERPTLRQFYYYADKHLSRVEDDAIKTSLQEQRNNKRLLISDSMSNVSYPGEMCEIDACELDVSLVSEFDTSKTVGRPTAYVLIDVFTRMILAVSIGFDVNSNIGITNLFMNLSENKVNYCARYGLKIDSRMWVSNVVPSAIRCDRGSDFKSKDFERICNSLNIRRELVSGGTGSLKGVVEQSFRQLHLAQEPIFEGKGLITKRYDSKHHKEATLTLSEYIPFVLRAIVTHNEQYMQGYKLSKKLIKANVKPIPITLWEYGCANIGAPKPIKNVEQFRYDIMLQGKASITRRGICFKKLYFLCPADKVLLDDMYAKGTSYMIIHYDPRSTDAVFYIRNEQMMVAELNKAITGNGDFKGLTWEEAEEITSGKAAMDREGRAYNEALRADLFRMNMANMDACEKNNYADPSNMKDNRKKEKIATQKQNNIVDKLKSTLPEYEEIEEEQEKTPEIAETEGPSTPEDIANELKKFNSRH